MKAKIGTAMSRRTKVVLTAAVLVALLIVFTLTDLAWAGTRTLSLGEVWAALTGHGTWANDLIVNHQNLPRIVAALFIGAGLAVTGSVMQAVFRNPLATPYILGLSSGASLGAAIAIMLPSTLALSFIQPVLAFGMCLLTTFLVYAVSRAGGTMVRTETLVLAGVAISSLFSAVVSLLTYIAPSEKMGSIVFWSMGSLGEVGTDELAIIVPIIVAGILIMLTQSRNLNAMMLGDAHAMDLGVDVRRVRIWLLVVSSLVVAACVAFVGTIGFIGLVIPHILRMVLGPDNRLIMPMSVLGGGAFLLMSDWAAHVVSPLYGVLPIGVVTAMVGAPFFIYLLCRRKREVGW
ncbi:MAG: iron ABC transporter permease [Thermoplasmata archaeon]|nr:iron ABC transporter permease [Thermoplasmata archaeon]